MSSQEQTPRELSIVIVNPGGAGRGSGSGSRGGRGRGSRSGRGSRGGRGGHGNSSDNRSSTPVVQANNQSNSNMQSNESNNDTTASQSSVPTQSSPEHWIEAEERALLTAVSKHYDELTHPRDNNHRGRTWDAIIEDFKKECTPLASPIVTDGTQESEQSLDEHQPPPSSLVVEPSSISSDDQATSSAAAATAATAATDPSASDFTNDNSTVETFGNVRTKRAIKTKWERMCSRYHSCFTERHRQTGGSGDIDDWYLYDDMHALLKDDPRFNPEIQFDSFRGIRRRADTQTATDSTLQPSARRRRLTPAELRHEDVLERIDAANQQSEEARSQLIELLDQQHKEILEAQERRHQQQQHTQQSFLDLMKQLIDKM